ncbi:MAG: NAD(P)-dependent alcohol dehydrogenase [Saprospiraceae bacterium]
MKVIEVNPPGGLTQLKVVERPDPMPGPGEILVQWHATSLNYHDYLVAIGLIPVPAGRIPMSDGAGEILAVGENVKEWKAGDKVMSMFFPNWIEGKPTLKKTMSIMGETTDGCMAEKACLPAYAVTAMPEGYSFAEAATLPCAALTAWRALMVEGQLKAGDSVLIEGTGGMSIFAFQLAKAAGARVFATTSSAEKAERLKAMGAEHVLNYKDDPKWGRTINKLSGGGVDHVLDVGGGSTMGQSIDAVAIGGHIASIGILGNGRTGEIVFPKLFFKHIKMNGLAVGSNVMQQDMVTAINANKIRPIIDRSFAFEELAEAFQYQASGGHFGKIVMEF